MTNDPEDIFARTCAPFSSPAVRKRPKSYGTRHGSGRHPRQFPPEIADDGAELGPGLPRHRAVGSGLFPRRLVACGIHILHTLPAAFPQNHSSPSEHLGGRLGAVMSVSRSRRKRQKSGVRVSRSDSAKGLRRSAHHGPRTIHTTYCARDHAADADVRSE